VHYLIDGYSVIHAWPDLKRALDRRLAHARELLVQRLQGFQDHRGEAVTVFFDGRSGPRNPKLQPHDLEIVFSDQGQTADMRMEQRVGSVKKPGIFIVVTADHAIVNTVGALGAMTLSPERFLEELQAAEKEVAEWLDEARGRNKRRFQGG